MTDSYEAPAKRVRKIIHIDMDCFYAAVEMRDRPELRGKPIAVGGSPQSRGVVATSNYEARAFGVRSAMASAKAVRLCPELIMVRPNFAKYKADSLKVRAILERYADEVEPLSLDEAYIDVTDSPAHGNSASLIAMEIRDAIRRETGLTASAGIAPNKFLAKIASEWNKPDGQKTIAPSEVAAFARELPIEKIWGVGKVTAAKMRMLGLKTCGDLERLTLAELAQHFGSWSEQLYKYARGEDDRPVKADRSRKSLSVENTFSEDLLTLRQCLDEVPELYEEWDKRIQRARLSPSWREEIKGVFVKLKFSDFKSMTREAATSAYPKVSDFQMLIEKAYAARPEPVRLIGIGTRFDGAKSTPARDTPQLLFKLD